ncbi:hypothetical protein [Luteolibacter marinus]|uniref:hypothetical protein n=1 Tax=Luteolibacter marinus TaxID=2776705 RepID=UPI001D02D951|nr:hypothetical protein [Luteolibacter marinus]
MKHEVSQAALKVRMNRVRDWYTGVSPALAIRLLVLPVMLSVIDFSVTLSFQPPEYWDGDRAALVEANPIARWVLMAHPLLIVPAMLAWYALVFPLVFQTPARIGLRVIAAHLLAYPISISGWLVRMCKDGWGWVALLVISVAILTIGILWPFRRQWNSPVRIHR